jgi:hypothetical protein
MKFWQTLTTFLVLAVTVCVLVIACNNTQPQASASLPPEKMTDYIYEIIKAQKKVYGKLIVERLGQANVVKASENWEQDDALPIPAQMFTMTAEESSQNGDFSYGSISPWSINEKHIPRTEFEKTAMEKILETGLAQKGYQTKDGRRYFSAVYPDVAVTDACVTCHNNHPIHKQRYPNKVFKKDDIMGGILINIPLDEG